MGTKTRYREPKELAEKIAETIPPSEKIPLDSEPAADAVVVHHDAPPKEAVNEATARLQRQIEELRRSEELQRRAATMPQRPPTREQMLSQVSPEWRTFLEANPRLLNNFQLAANAAAQALKEGHALGSEAQMGRTRELVDHHLGLQAQATGQPYPPASEPEHVTPQNDYRPTPTMQPPSRFRPLPESTDEDRRSAFVSAPVSREVPSASGSRGSRQIRLSAEEREAAKMAGISEVEYAKQKQRFAEARENEGRYGDRRYS
jgi:hypothetical protein